MSNTTQKKEEKSSSNKDAKPKSLFSNQSGRTSPILMKKKGEDEKEFYARMAKYGWQGFDKPSGHWKPDSSEYHSGEQVVCPRCKKLVVLPPKTDVKPKLDDPKAAPSVETKKLVADIAEAKDAKTEKTPAKKDDVKPKTDSLPKVDSSPKAALNLDLSTKVAPALNEKIQKKTSKK